MRKKHEFSTVGWKYREKQDKFLILALFLISLASWLGYYLTHRTPALQAEVTVDGQPAKTLDLTKNQEITIEGINGGTNLLIIQDGEIWCEEASCPDKVCIRQGKQSQDGEMIVCLPNRMIVQVVGAGEG